MQNQEEDYLPSLITATPFEGRQVALKLARKSIGTIQTDAGVRQQLRAAYASDTAQLVASAHVIALEFQYIAQANNY